MVGRLLSTLLAGWILVAGFMQPRPALAADFDFYVLSLSWSPTWCAGHDADGRTAQCNGKHRYSLVVHGLWPQNEHGYPENCRSSEPDRVPNNLIRSLYDIVPSAGLAGHEWRAHGTCSGLSQERFFGQLRAAFSKVRVPLVIFNGSISRKLRTDDIENLMISTNPGLPRDGIAVTCEQGQLAELRICMTKSLDFRSCGEVARQSCRQSIVTLPPIP